ncbi:MAG TPA: hypothetical protein VI038_02235, partial [Methyloceanibacter sp.]
IIVDGDAGAYLGSKMRAGKIAVSGSAGAFAGASMRGGMIDIARDAGEPRRRQRRQVESLVRLGSKLERQGTHAMISLRWK